MIDSPFAPTFTGALVPCRSPLWAIALPDFEMRAATITSGNPESFSSGLLEYPQYTRPQEFEGRSIPEVLSGGNHSEIAKYRLAQALGLTRERRPDLWTLYEKAKS